MQTITDKADILERLRIVEPDRPGIRTRWYRNPDGPEAANVIEALRREVREQRREIAGLRWERAALIAADRPMTDRLAELDQELGLSGTGQSPEPDIRRGAARAAGADG